MANVLYTIGYSGYKIKEFIDEIKEHKISSVIDVRSVPYSQHHSDYNKEPLETLLKANGIIYRNYAKEFGAQQKNKDFYSSGGYLDFEKFTKSEEFLSGVEKLKAGMDKGYSFTLMCAEKDPFNCHRTIMVAREFSKIGLGIIHLSPIGHEQSQEDIEAQLLECYFPNRNQLVLFESEDLSSQDLISQAYKKRNAEIGYKMEGDEHDSIYDRIYTKTRTAVL